MSALARLLGCGVLGLLLTGVGCDPDDDKPPCQGDSDCQNGVWCDGWERCDPASAAANAQGCVRGATCPAMVTTSAVVVNGSSSAIVAGCREPVLRQLVLTACLRRESGGGVVAVSPGSEPDCAVSADDVAVSCSYTPCDRDSACNDGLFCNGEERCFPGDDAADARGCVTARSGPCPEDRECLEDERYCRLPECTVPDADGDGSVAQECGGNDCDDTNPRRYPGAGEVCDRDNLDEDCDPSTFGNRDADGDGFIDDRCCNGDRCGDDCDDADLTIHPTQSEVCNGYDDNCDGSVDEGVSVRVYPDGDGDGFGQAGSDFNLRCAGQAGWASIAGDCDDSNPQIIPGAIRCSGDPLLQDFTSYELCTEDGTWESSKCQTDCITQPGGHGICAP